MPKISIYDPFVDAFREVEVEVAKKFIASVEGVQKQVDAIENPQQ